MSVNRREGFYKTLNHERPSQLILDLGGCPLSSMEGRGMSKLLDFLGYKYDENSFPEGEYLFGEFRKLDERILEYLDIDTRSVGTILKPEKSLFQKLSANEYIDEWGIRRLFNGMYWENNSYPLKGASVNDFDDYPWPDPNSINIKRIERETDIAKYLNLNTDYVICAEHPVYGIFELGCWMCGFEDFLMKMILDTDFVKKFFEIILNYQKTVIEIYYGMLGSFIHYTSSGDDFATKDNTFISPDIFRNLIKPYLKERVDYTKKFTNAFFLHHCYGNVYPLIPDLIDVGVEILNPIQPVNKDMSPETLKSNYGEKICFHGGIDTQSILPFGTKEIIEQKVQSVIDVLSNEGGYIFAAAHNIQEDVPPENLVIMFKAARNLY